MQDAKEEIKSRLAVEDVVGQYVELKRAGRTLKGHSPWGVDKTPSFMVSPEKGIWHDFSANKGGDIFTFVMEVEGISFREAMEKLAAQAGVDLSSITAATLPSPSANFALKKLSLSLLNITKPALSATKKSASMFFTSAASSETQFQNLKSVTRQLLARPCSKS